MSEEKEPEQQPESRPHKRGSTPDGPRYVVGLQDKVDKCRYKDIFEGEKEYEAKEKADDLAKKEQRATIVYDRKEMRFIHRVPGPEAEKKEEAAPEPKGKRRRK